uniref:BZIP domain-containing protein n=1 Tax=Mola mola TaxID=94237 RepID=A0A3Q3VQB6_MOLML
MSTPGSPDPRESAAPCLPTSSVESSVYVEPDPWNPGFPFPVTRSPLLTQRHLRSRACGIHGPVTRRTREMIPQDRKDEAYWNKRNKNNDAAKRSREKRRLKDLMLEGRLLALSDENAQLRAQLLDLRYDRSLRAEKCLASSVEAHNTLTMRILHMLTFSFHDAINTLITV